MRKLVAFLSAILIILSLVACATTGNKNYTEKEIEVYFQGEKADKTIKVRFYQDQPNVPYYGLRAYSEMIGTNVLTCRKTADGKLVFTNSRGIEAVADPEKGTLSSQDWTSFRSPALPYETKIALKDSDTKIIRITDVTADKEANSLTLDFAKHGLRMYAEEDDVYISLTMASNLFTDISTWLLKWNGERARYLMGDSPSRRIDLDSPMMEELISKGTRPSDVAEETYAELCFIMDYLYGHPGRAVLDEAIAQKGLNQALLDMGEEGERIARGLKSTDGYDYLLSMVELFMYYLGDGSHTEYNDGQNLLNYFTPNEREKYLKSFGKLLTSYTDQIIMTNEYVKYARMKLWGEDWYHEYDNTAIISIDDMEMEDEKWIEFYNGAGEIPQDCIGRTVLGLRRASENPDIKNIILDCSANLGGNFDALAFISYVTTGNSDVMGFDRTTGRTITVHSEVDANLDGVYDEKDREGVYTQFKYGVITTMSSFSCGNILPFIMRNAGALIIGETSGGGSCQVQMASLPDGTAFCLSSSQFRFLDPGSPYSETNIVEEGCPVDYPISKILVRMEKDGVEYDGKNYLPFFDMQMLNDIMNK